MSPIAVALGAGLVTSFGPCIAPRFVAIAALSSDLSNPRRWLALTAFVTGLCTSYVLLGTIAGVLGAIAARASYIYAALAIVMIGTGIAAIARPQRSDRCACAGSRAAANLPSGAAFAAGFAFSAVSSPCCGPIVAAMAGAGAAEGNVTLTASTLAAFALGHALPLAALAVGSLRVQAIRRFRDAEAFFSTVGGGLAIALGSYYALLA